MADLYGPHLQNDKNSMSNIYRLESLIDRQKETIHKRGLLLQSYKKEILRLTDENRNLKILLKEKNKNGKKEDNEQNREVH